MSESPESAFHALIDYLKEKSKNSKIDKDNYLKWQKSSISKLPDGYSLKELVENEVFEGEWS